MNDIRQRIDVFTPIALRVAATLRLADHIVAGTTKLDDLAGAAGADPDTLGRLLRFLTCRGIFAEPEPGHYALTPTAGWLCADHPSRLREFLDLDSVGGLLDLAVCGGLLATVRTGQAGYAQVFGRPFWDDLADKPDLAASFTALMTAVSLRLGPEAARGYDWTAVRTVVDVGGGAGYLVSEVLRANPDATGTLVDLPGTGPAALANLAAAGVADRCAFAGQSFFDELPAGADVYVLSHVLHDWDDEHAVAVLRRCAQALAGRPDSRVLVVERVIAEDEHRPLTTEYDLRMAVIFGGARERTYPEFVALAAAAGLAPGEVRNTPSQHWLMSWQPVSGLPTGGEPGHRLS